MAVLSKSAGWASSFLEGFVATLGLVRVAGEGGGVGCVALRCGSEAKMKLRVLVTPLFVRVMKQTCCTWDRDSLYAGQHLVFEPVSILLR